MQRFRASTGGFTDCLLQHGAAKVFAIDVGYGQLAWSIRSDPRVVTMERTNIRYVKPEDLSSLWICRWWMCPSFLCELSCL